LKLIFATINVFQIKHVALIWDLNRLEAVVLSRTREKGDFHHISVTAGL
jgi:hypothetical protein